MTEQHEMTVRVLNEVGEPIASFFRGEPGEPTPGFSDALRDALLAFRKEYPEARFVDVEFTRWSRARPLSQSRH